MVILSRSLRIPTKYIGGKEYKEKIWVGLAAVSSFVPVFAHI